MQEEWIHSILEEARRHGLERQARVYPACGGKIAIEGGTLLNFASNDYLDLARHPHVADRARQALERYGAGATASRLVVGSLPIHEELEARLAREKGTPAALLFGSGYMANAGTLPVLVGRGDLVFADKLVHASLIDACRLSGATLIRFAHNDVHSLEARLQSRPAAGRRKLILTESVFSMDGDLAPLGEIAALAERHGAMLMVDEAHASGIFGPHGAGRICEYGLEKKVTVSMGTLSKAFGGYGGFVACSAGLRDLLVHSARAFIFTTAPPPAVVGAALGALDVLAADPSLGVRLLANATFFRGCLQSAGLDTAQSASQIIPVLLGENERALTVARTLRERGIVVAAIRPPTVPAGTARLRLSVTLAHTRADLDGAAKQIASAVQAS